MLLPSPEQDRLRRKFSRYTRAAKDAVARVLMAGATLDQGGGLSYGDERHLGHFLKDLKAEGADVSPRFEVSIANIGPQYGGEDVLKQQFEADAVAVCYVHNPDPGELWLHDLAAPGGYLAISELHFSSPAVWHDRIVDTGARAVWVRGDEPLEIRAAHFEREGSPLVLARKGSLMDASTALFLRRDYAETLTPETGLLGRVARALKL